MGGLKRWWLKQSSKNINNSQDWTDYINQLGLEYITTNDFLNELRTNANNMIDFCLSNNYLNLNNYAYVLKLVPSSYIWFSNIMIVLITLINLPLLWLMFYFNKHNKYNMGY